ncbi:MAG: WYL domain-containing protein [Bacteroides sp.]|nr:WYL domain-containing protein [Bacteroides sp.]MCM1095685.1 WYL domain-containing protein [Terasakiella sp.]
MTASELFNRYIWLVDLIYRTDGITREEINRYWSRSQYNIDNEDEIPERTFHRHKDAIKELFDIDIYCDRSDCRKYKIANRDEMERGGVRAWLLNMFAVNALINESLHLKRRILFEDIPSGQSFLSPIIMAMRDGCAIDIEHRKFDSSPRHVVIEPYCVKVFRQRWYVLGHRTHDGAMRVYALDRILSLKQTETKFNLPKDFDADVYFSESIGVILDAHEPELIELRAMYGQQNYFRSLPLHHSQTEKERNQDYSVFTFFLRPTFDFIQELLKYGASVEILSPQWLRNRFKTISRNMCEIYTRE